MLKAFWQEFNKRLYGCLNLATGPSQSGLCLDYGTCTIRSRDNCNYAPCGGEIRKVINTVDERPLRGKIELLYEFEGGYNEIAYWAKGHLDEKQFRDEVEEEYGYIFPTSKVIQAYARNVPVGPDRPSEMIIHLDVDQGHGAYPITFIDLIC